jgi:hypothetical protein
MRKLRIEPVLVMAPGYVAFYLDPQGKELAALETTLPSRHCFIQAVM